MKLDIHQLAPVSQLTQEHVVEHKRFIHQYNNIFDASHYVGTGHYMKPPVGQPLYCGRGVSQYGDPLHSGAATRSLMYGTQLYSL